MSIPAEKNILRDMLAKFQSNHLFKNSFYLMLNGGLMSVSGFIFWVISTHIFNPKDVGIVTTIVANINLIAYFSLLGLNSTLVRFLPVTERKNDLINTAFLFAGSISLISSVVFALYIPHISHELAFIQKNIWFLITFVIITVLMTLNILTDSVFTGYRRGDYVLYTDGTMSVSRLILPIFFAGLGVLGLFLAYSTGVVIAVFFSLILMFKRLAYIYAFPKIQEGVRDTFNYTWSNYVVGLLQSIPLAIFPILITNELGPQNTAFFSMAMTIVGAVHIIPQMITNSLLVESSWDTDNSKKLAVTASKIIAGLLIPAAFLIFFFGSYILLIFGHLYLTNGTALLKILIVASLFYATTSVLYTILKVQNRMKELIGITLIGTLFMCFACYWLVPKGIEMVGVVWLLGQIIMGILCAPYLFRNPAHKNLRMP